MTNEYSGTPDTQQPQTPEVPASPTPAEQPQTVTNIPARLVRSEPVSNTPTSVEGAEDPGNGRYVIGTWNGMPRYQCTHCPYDTVESADALDYHFALEHGPGDIVKPYNTEVQTDRFGNVVSGSHPVQVKQEVEAEAGTPVKSGKAK